MTLPLSCSNLATDNFLVVSFLLLQRVLGHLDGLAVPARPSSPSTDNVRRPSCTKFWARTAFMTNQMNKSGITVPRQRSYSRVTRQALTMLGKLIRVARAKRGPTAQELADRAGISRTTLSSIEKGAPGPEIGIVFEVASLVGVRLFNYDERTLEMHNARLDEKLTLLPKSVRHAVREVDDAF